MRAREKAAHIIREVITGVVIGMAIGAAMIMMISHDSTETGPDARNQARMMTSLHYEEEAR